MGMGNKIKRGNKKSDWTIFVCLSVSSSEGGLGSKLSIYKYQKEKKIWSPKHRSQALHIWTRGVCVCVPYALVKCKLFSQRKLRSVKNQARARGMRSRDEGLKFGGQRIYVCTDPLRTTYKHHQIIPATTHNSFPSWAQIRYEIASSFGHGTLWLMNQTMAPTDDGANNISELDAARRNSSGSARSEGGWSSIDIRMDRIMVMWIDDRPAPV